jgi:uncharacterized membrane protein YcfT
MRSLAPRIEIMGKAPRVEWVDTARGMAIVLVVLHHAVQRGLEAGVVVGEWQAVTELLRTMRMPLFFLCAGLFAATWVRGSWRHLLRSKVLLFAWVYVLWVVLRFAWFAIVVDQSFAGWTELLKRPVLPFDGWFVYTLAILFVIARAAVRVPAKVQVGVAAALSAFWFAGFADFGNRAWDGVPQFLFFFFVGCHFRSRVFEVVDTLTWRPVVGVVALWIGLYWLLDAAELQEAPGINFALRLLGVVVGVALATRLTGAAWLRRLGRATLPIYMTHVLWIAALIRVAEIVLGTSAPVWLQATVPLLLVVLAVVIARAFDRTMARLGAKWLFATPAWVARLFDALARQRVKPSADPAALRS